RGIGIVGAHSESGRCVHIRIGNCPTRSGQVSQSNRALAVEIQRASAHRQAASAECAGGANCNGTSRNRSATAIVIRAVEREVCGTRGAAKGESTASTDIPTYR